MFLKNKYTKYYNSIISNALIRNTDNNIYTEKHHILPSSLGGNNDKSNLVILSAREHFICHLLLIRMTSGKEKSKMVYAAWAMANLKNDNQIRKKISSRTYAQLREIFTHQHSVFRAGQTHTEETKEKLRKPKKFRNGVSPLKNIPRSKSVKDKISNSKSGKSHTDEHTKNVAESRKIKIKYNWHNIKYGDINCTIWHILENYPARQILEFKLLCILSPFILLALFFI